MTGPYSSHGGLLTRRYRASIGVLSVLALVLAACGAGPDTAADGADSAPSASPTVTAPTTAPATTLSREPLPTIAVTTTIWADVVSRVTCNSLAEVITIIPAGADSHTFEPSLRDRATLSTARLIISNGLDLEETLLPTIDAVAAEGVARFAMADAIDDLLESSEEDDGHGHGGSEAMDPHLWFDPARVARALPALSQAIIEATDLDANQVEACTEAYHAELVELDGEISDLFAALPAERRVLVTNHETLGYLADRYEFQVIGTVLSGSSSLAETNPAALEDLARVIIAAGLPAIFAEAETSSRDITALAERVGNLQVVTLLTESLDAPGTSADTYIGFLRTAAAAIADALSV
jgi:zinc/manganese transport system substrate-binding protein